MSDEEYEYDYGSDADSIQYSDDGDEPEQDDSKIAVENAFYEASDKKDEDVEEAIRLYEDVVKLDTDMESKGENVEWRFKALQELVTLYFNTGNSEMMVRKYNDMLKDMHLATPNESTNAINNVLETVGASNDDKVLAQVFEVTLEALKTANNERLWFNTNLKLAKLYMNNSSNEKIHEIERILNTLKGTCVLPDGKDDPSKASSLLEVYAMEMQFCRLTGDTIRMKTIYPKTLQLQAAISDPRIMGVIREEGGKMHMQQNQWDEAYNELNEAFRNFQQAGNNNKAKACLKYVALSSMLGKTEINPFDAREAKVFERDTDVVAIINLRRHLQENDLNRFEKVLNDPRNGILEEPVLMTYIQPLRRRMREQVLINLTRPYDKVSISFLSEQLHITEVDVENMLLDMILAHEISAQIDQINGCVLLDSSTSMAGGTDHTMKSIASFADSIIAMSEELPQKIN